MKKLLLSLIGIFASLVLTAEVYTSNALVAGTPLSVIAAGGNVHIVELTFTATTAAATTLKLYDTSGTSTNMTTVAYSEPFSYQTNMTILYTNNLGVTITNTFSGTFTTQVTSNAATVQRPILVAITVPGNGSKTKPVNLYLTRGLLALSDAAGIIETTYTGP